ncbi:taste receptor type 2 member 103 isoform X2 [Rattus norvegicus]|uniref:Taste receptor type 2 n=1 Tax=Rattus norvegicus TaxID=10116 RepID=A0ABK0L9Q3_RAT|nr:taste receptor type 2 member 103 isoform X1 [Rattus norvegicus]XP_038962815.1 taste receptor type 2 member 103 isoform X1 [Rattus norvegicus]XP_038962816.1 taste receptor type 2 member 103 isoform X1 [Rattus norvegicus]XP_038962817.1 taste receptor type 2 member 103 isoform X1 [Rattus norvegicus]XP_038962818.1 taste receptor type 2 member 103 isoform X1 [Rattus norvegicus]XP_038962819.1 taste receptor type 2 member 103 isoform X1 [Rattus norvegicus]XP_038962820.1 taste receptor type 2 memb|eukprot:XP_017447862.1 PREDICTED: taste receptor type 2 member 103 isoform X1 [Rattus norvegicus]
MVVTMRAALRLMLISTVSLELIIGILANVFIALVNIIDWIKRGKISAVDKIYMGLAISRTAFVLSLITGFLIAFLDPASLGIGIMIRLLTISWTVTNHFSVWFATCLSIFYFLKITNFSNTVFLALKWKVKKVVSVTLVVSLIILFINVIVIHIYTDRFQVNMVQKCGANNTLRAYGLFLSISTVFTFIPFTTSLTMFLLLIFSLWRHLKTMHHNATGSRDVSTVAHIKGLQTVVAFLLLYTVFAMSLFSQSLSIDAQHTNLLSHFLRCIGVAFPSGHSCALILGNNKLRQASLSVIFWLRCKYKHTENQGP